MLKATMCDFLLVFDFTIFVLALNFVLLDSVPSAIITPKRRLSLNDMDDSMQSPSSLEGDTGM